ncbi:Crp/Fnr family transcriptional regulator [Niallia sp. Krafla_26]|uniref:Crp/Fnr family transcriptional regulator n=1 Tax=Niallia sp. Krafla_26 TaxID=3064703 RepID=UPI003D17AFBC
MDLTFIKKIPFFQGLEDHEYQLLSPLLIEKEVKKGQHIFHEGDVGTESYLIKQGRVKIYRLTNGKESILALLHKGDFFGEMAMLDPHNSRSASAVALEKTNLLQLREKDMTSLLHKKPELAIKLLSLTMEKLRRANEKIQSITFLDVRTRIHRLILQLVQDYGIQTSEGVFIDYKITHQQMADLIGAVRETVSKILAEWQQEGWIIMKNRKMIIKDFSQFEQLIQED